MGTEKPDGVGMAWVRSGTPRSVGVLSKREIRAHKSRHPGYYLPVNIELGGNFCKVPNDLFSTGRSHSKLLNYSWVDVIPLRNDHLPSRAI